MTVYTASVRLWWNEGVIATVEILARGVAFKCAASSRVSIEHLTIIHLYLQDLGADRLQLGVLCVP